MTTIEQKLPPINTRRELYGSFIQPKWRSNGKKGDYLDEYQKAVENPNTNAYRFTVAGAVILLLGGGGYVFGGKHLAKYASNLNKSVREQANNFDKNVFSVVKEKFNTGVLTYFIGDKYKDSGIMQGLRAIDKGFGKTPLRFFKPGEWVINVSKFSLHLVTGKELKSKYKGVSNGIDDAFDFLSNPKKSLNDNEKTLVEGTEKILEELQGSLGAVRNGTNKRLTALENDVEKNHIKHFLDNYFIKVPKKLNDLSEWKKNSGEVVKNWRKAIDDNDLDVLRHGWEETEAELRNRLMSSKTLSGKSFGDCIETLDAELKKLGAVAKQDDAGKNFKKYVDDLIKIRNKIDIAVKYETNGRGDGYAGRAIDLYGGGGIQETLVPLAIGGIITHSTVKNSKKDDSPIDISKKFMNTGGLEFLGGLSSMMYINYKRGINGPKGILFGAGTAFGLNLAKKIYGRIIGKEPDKIEKTEKT